ncbi:MAG: LysM peptidoglycan-binding domain-containing protein [Anaerolineae bacterium]|nr:LysM peptidoglycan-binding domain-containing protein [Anaerolineae bacterium]MDW8172833.1 LysM peptidoglycan-binding domain-containing protein [Anaerolineae bacterium]
MRRWFLSWVVYALLALALAACYQQGLSEESSADLMIAQAFTASPSPSPALASQASPLAADGEAGQIVLVAENSTPLFQGTAIAQEADTWSLTATAYVALITQTQEISLTQTAFALGIGIPPTAAPTFELATATFPPAIEPTQPGIIAPGPLAPGGSCIHEVRAGDNLFRLSLYYGLPIRTIATANGIANINLIVVGQKLTIPGCGTTGNFPPPTSFPTSTPGFGIGGPGTGSVGGTIHVVDQYETLFIISQRYGVPVNSIAAANGIANINMIMIGQQLVIPGR